MTHSVAACFADGRDGTCASVGLLKFTNQFSVYPTNNFFPHALRAVSRFAIGKNFPLIQMPIIWGLVR